MEEWSRGDDEEVLRGGGGGVRVEMVVEGWRRARWWRSGIIGMRRSQWRRR